MGDYTWDYLQTFSVGAEQWLESEPSHVAVLTARAMHAEQVAANDAPVDPAPVDPPPAPTKKGK